MPHSRWRVPDSEPVVAVLVSVVALVAWGLVLLLVE